MYSPGALSAMRMVRHGVVKAPLRSTGAPVAEGARCARSFWPSTLRSHMEA